MTTQKIEGGKREKLNKENGAKVVQIVWKTIIAMHVEIDISSLSMYLWVNPPIFALFLLLFVKCVCFFFNFLLCHPFIYLWNLSTIHSMHRYTRQCSTVEQLRKRKEIRFMLALVVTLLGICVLCARQDCSTPKVRSLIHFDDRLDMHSNSSS